MSSTLLSHSILATTLLTLGSLVSNVECQVPSSGETNLIALKSTVWPGRQIPVCWEPRSGNQYSTEKQWTRSATANTWGSSIHGVIRFTGWGVCTTNQNAIRIQISDEGPYTQGLGTDVRGVSNGMVLNFEFKNWCPGCIDATTTREAAIRNIAVHEFGHVLGFDHEHSRPQAKPSNFCSKEDVLKAQNDFYKGDWPVSKYDLDSVMNYCNPEWGGGGTLSVLDVKGLLTLYKTLEGYYDKCTLASGPRTLNCVAAASRYCSSAQGKGAGFTQAIVTTPVAADKNYGILCASPSLLRWVPWDQIPGCQGYSQFMSCFATLSGYCRAKSSTSLGIIQETRGDAAKVACVSADTRSTVSVATLRSYHSGCTSLSLAQSSMCTNAAMQYCRTKSRYSGAVIYGTERDLFKVGCVWTDTIYRHVRVEKGL